jgi:ArsR family transcriptional regulator, arsenate/arsenite/antimonite-responsive transcriptional repressor
MRFGDRFRQGSLTARVSSGNGAEGRGRSLLNAKATATVKPPRTKAQTKDKPTMHVSDKTIAGLADVFGLLADKSRLKILLALAKDKEMHVSALCSMLGQSQPAVSHHLTLLRMKDLVGFRRDGKHNYYRVESDRICQLLEQFFADSGSAQQLQFPGFSLAYKAGNGSAAKKR